MGLDLLVIGKSRPGYEEEWLKLVRRRFDEDSSLTEKDFERFDAISILPQDSTPRSDGYKGEPRYTHAGLYPGVDETSFRGKFLEVCTAVLEPDLLKGAWAYMMPNEAVAYGRALAHAIEQVKVRGPLPPPPPPRRGLLARLLFGEPKPVEECELSEQLDIVQAASEWYTYWGERGYPILIYY